MERRRQHAVVACFVLCEFLGVAAMHRHNHTNKAQTRFTTVSMVRASLATRI